MRLAFVVQRYGVGVAGGAEAACREFATRLAARGHDVHAVTSCAESYVDWANTLPSGEAHVDGVTVHRLPVARPRDNRQFERLNARVFGSSEVPLYLQRAWMEMQGPNIPELDPWLRRHASGFDVVVFFTYLYFTTWKGTEAAFGRVPTLMHPTAHDEPSFYLPLFDEMWWRADAYAFLTEEEQALLCRRSGARAVHRGPNEVVGVGTELDVTGDADRFRRTYGLGDRPYVLFVGRLDPGKGTDELFHMFVAYKERNPGPLALVVVGDPVVPMPDHSDVVITGFVEEQTRDDALLGSLALVQPSPFESFSMVLTEAWACSIPALVQGKCDVLAGRSRRSGGGIPYQNYGEFEAALDILQTRPELRRQLGAAGRSHVEANYAWPVVIDHYEGFLHDMSHVRPGPLR